MEAYPPVPASWYITTFSVTLAMTLVLIETAPLQLPAWGVFLAIFVALVFLVPVGIISAVSETTIGENPVSTVLIDCLRGFQVLIS